MNLHGDNYVYVECKDGKMARRGNHMIWISRYKNMPRSWSGISHTNHIPDGGVINIGE
jgi:hypothetical protein